MAAFRQQLAGDMKADEAGRAGDQYCLIRHSNPQGYRPDCDAPAGPLYPSCRGCRNTQLPGYCQIGLKTIPRRTKFNARSPDRAFLTLSRTEERAPHAPDPAFSAKDTDLRGAALSRAPQGRFLRTRLALQRRESGLDRPCDRRDCSCRSSSACCAGARSAPSAARRSDRAGDALQRDRDILQPDAALLDRRRRGAALAGGARRRRLAGGDLLHLRRSRDRPDRACDHHRGDPAMELPV